MAAIADLMKSGIWFDRPRFEEAEYKYQEFLVRGKTVSGVKGDTKKAVETSGGTVAQQIAEARQKIQNSLKDAPSSVSSESDIDTLRKQIENLTLENEELRKTVVAVAQRFEKLEGRLSVLEGNSGQAQPEKNEATAVTTNGVDDEDSDSDSDVDLFGSDDEEETAEAERIKAERIAAYNEKKSKKVAVIAKSTIVLDVKPWDDETDMAELEKCVRTIETDGLKWGASKLVKVAFGIMKLQISCVVEDDKVGTDFLEERITSFEDFIQSVDIIAFNKI